MDRDRLERMAQGGDHVAAAALRRIADREGDNDLKAWLEALADEQMSRLREAMDVWKTLCPPPIDPNTGRVRNLVQDLYHERSIRRIDHRLQQLEERLVEQARGGGPRRGPVIPSPPPGGTLETMTRREIQSRVVGDLLNSTSLKETMEALYAKEKDK